MDYFLIYKPYGVLSQFKAEPGQEGLGSLFSFPPDVYPVGRLDADSEGLLLLTNDKKVNQLLLSPAHRHWRTYLVQVEGNISEEALEKMASGVTIQLDGKSYRTRPGRATHIPAPELPERHPPIRYRKTVPDSWLELCLAEGKNRQVRKMTAATGFPTLRLVRIAIEDLRMEAPFPGKVVSLSRQEVYRLLKLR